MKRMKFLSVVFIALLFSIGMMSAAAGSAAAADKAPEGTLRIAINSLGDELLDPISGSVARKNYLCLMFDWLIQADDDGNYNPDKSVASKWSWNKDAMTWTFWIRSGIKFHNGDPLTPADVKFSIERFMSDKSMSTKKKELKKWIKDIEIVAPDQVVVHCKEKATFLPYYLSNLVAVEGVVMPKKYIEAKGADYFLKNPIGSGAYRLADQVMGSHMKFEAMPTRHWWAGMPRYKHVYLAAVPEAAVRVARLKTEEADIVQISREEVSKLKAGGFRVFAKPGLVTGLLMVQQWNPKNPLSKLKVRKAMALAINKKELLQYVFNGMGKVATMWPPVKGSLGWFEVPAHPYDPEQAKKLLAEAGYPKGFKLDMWSYPYKGYGEAQVMIEAIAGYFQNIGIDVKIIKGEYLGIRTRAANDTVDNLASTFYIASPAQRYYVGWMSFCFGSKGVWHFTKSPTIDANIEAAWQAENDDQFSKEIAKVFKEVYDNYHTIPLVEIGLLWGANDRIKDWQFSVADFDMNLVYLCTQR